MMNNDNNYEDEEKQIELKLTPKGDDMIDDKDKGKTKMKL